MKIRVKVRNEFGKEKICVLNVLNPKNTSIEQTKFLGGNHDMQIVIKTNTDKITFREIK